jgi:hypothetical protein
LKTTTLRKVPDFTTGPKPMMNDKEFKMITAALCSFIVIGQINGEPEKKRNGLIACIKHLLKGKEVYNKLTLFLKVKKG